MLTGLVLPNAGDAFIFGKSIIGDITILRKRFGICPQQNTLYDLLDVQDHLRLYAIIKGVPFSRINEECQDIAMMLGIENMLNIKSFNLSGGYKRKLCLALALIGGSSVVVLDEPTSGK